MLIRFWSKISRMFLCMFLLITLMLKNVYSIVHTKKNVNTEMNDIPMWSNYLLNMTYQKKN